MFCSFLHGDAIVTFLAICFLRLTTMATNKGEAITYQIFYTLFVVEFGALVDKNCVEALCGGSVMEDCDKER